MRTQIENSLESGPVSEGELGIVEAFLGGNLPKEYRQFMLEHNGGQPIPNCFDIPGDIGGSSLNRFYPVRSKRKTSDLIWTFKTLSGRIPNDLLPIGCDPGGSQICIAISGKNYGAIFYWDHENEPSDHQPEHNNMYLIASTFNGFLTSLHKIDERAL